QYKDYMIPQRGTVTDLNRVRAKMGLSDYVAGKRFTSVGAPNVVQSFKGAAGTRMLGWDKLGIPMGKLMAGMAVFAGAVSAMRLICPDQEVMNATDDLVKKYEDALQLANTGRFNLNTELALTFAVSRLARLLGSPEAAIAAQQKAMIASFR